MLTAQLTQNKQQKGFTLIELLVVIGILAILLAIVLIAINPARQFGQASNTRRQSDVTQILNAVGAYEADNAGALPAGIPVTAIGATPTPVDASFICTDIVPTYMPALPVEPTAQGEGNVVGAAYTSCATVTPAAGVTAYTVERDSSGHVTVKAQTTDNGATIQNSR
jgi:type IV pilus assembly protein PilA